MCHEKTSHVSRCVIYVTTGWHVLDSYDMCQPEKGRWQ